MEANSPSIIVRPASSVVHLMTYCFGVPSANTTLMRAVTVQADEPCLTAERPLVPSGRWVITFLSRKIPLSMVDLIRLEVTVTLFCKGLLGFTQLKGSALPVSTGISLFSPQRPNKIGRFRTQTVIHSLFRVCNPGKKGKEKEQRDFPAIQVTLIISVSTLYCPFSMCSSFTRKSGTLLEKVGLRNANLSVS